MQGMLLGGRYLIQNTVGEGGMAYVYIANDTKLNRLVAIKVLHSHMLKNKDVRERFCNEARAVSRLEHPNIIKIYDYSGADSDQLWIVMELIDGMNLAQLTEKTQSRAVHPIIGTFIIREVCKALEKAHKIGLIHRDIKPENIMLTKTGHLKLMDFGIAKDLAGSNMTQTGTFMGSPSYMSPEQIKGESVDHRSDLYSLAVVYYEIITGKLPFTGLSTHDVIMKIMEGTYSPPKSHIPSLPKQIDSIICYGIQKKIDKRYQSANDISIKIDEFLASRNFVESHIELERYFKDPKKYLKGLDIHSKDNNTFISTTKNFNSATTRKREPFNHNTIQSNQPISVEPMKFDSATATVLTKNRPNYVQQTSTVHENQQIPEVQNYQPIHEKKKKPIDSQRPQQKKSPKGNTPVQQRQVQSKNQAVVTASWPEQLLSTILIGLLIALSIWGFLKFQDRQKEEVVGDNHPKLQYTEKNNIKKDPDSNKKTPKIKKNNNNKKTSVKSNTQIVKKPIQTRIKPKPMVKKANNQKKSVKPIYNVKIKKPIVKRPVVATKNTTNSNIKAAKPAFFSVVSNPASIIYLDGKKVGTTNMSPSGISWQQTFSGKHRLELKRNNFKTYTKILNLKENERVNLPIINLVKNKIADKKIIFKSKEIGFFIRVIDSQTGKQKDSFVMSSLIKEVTLPQGEYKIVIEYKSQKQAKNIDLSTVKRALVYNIKGFKK